MLPKNSTKNLPHLSFPEMSPKGDLWNRSPFKNQQDWTYPNTPKAMLLIVVIRLSRTLTPINQFLQGGDAFSMDAVFRNLVYVFQVLYWLLDMFGINLWKIVSAARKRIERM